MRGICEQKLLDYDVRIFDLLGSFNELWGQLSTRIIRFVRPLAHLLALKLECLLADVLFLRIRRNLVGVTVEVGANE